METDDAQAGQGPTPEQRARLARDRRWRLWVVAGGAVLFVVALVVGGLAGHSERPDRPVPWGSLVAVGAGALVLFAAAAVVGTRLRSRSTTLRRLVISGDRSTIRRVGRSLRRGEPVAGDDLEVARALLAQSRSQRWLPLLFVVIAVVNIGGALATLTEAQPPSTFSLVVRLAGGAVMLVGAAVVEVSRRRLLRGAERARVATEV